MERPSNKDNNDDIIRTWPLLFSGHQPNHAVGCSAEHMHSSPVVTPHEGKLDEMTQSNAILLYDYCVVD